MSRSKERRDLGRRKPLIRLGNRWGWANGFRPSIESIEARILLAQFLVPSGYPSITAAVAAANAAPDASNTVIVSSGIYHESNITITSPLTLVSVNGSGSTTIDGGNAATSQAGILRVVGTTGKVIIGEPGQGFKIENPPVRNVDGYSNIIDVENVQAPVTIQNNILIGLNGVNSPFDVGVLVEGTTINNPATIQNNTFQAMWQGVLYQQTIGAGSISNNTFQNLQPSYFTTGGVTYTYEPEGIFALTFGGSAFNVSGLTIAGNNFASFNGLAISVDGGYQGQTPAQFSNVQITSNVITSIGFAANDFRAGITLIDDADTAALESQGGVINSLVANNTLIAQTSCAAGSVGVWSLGANNGLMVQNNFIQNLDKGVLIAEQVSGAGYASGVTVNQNSFTGNNIGVSNPSPNAVDASNNYWGVTDATSVKAQANGGVNVAYNPWLLDSTDSMPNAGFQPNLSPSATDTLRLVGNDSVTTGQTYTLQIQKLVNDTHLGTLSSYTITWGDGSTQTVPAGTATVNHTYNSTSQPTYTISATVLNTANTSYQIANTIGVTVDKFASLEVTTLVATTSGFHVRFSDVLKTSVLNIYNGQDSTTANGGTSDVFVVGASTGPVFGSLKLDADNKGFTFIATGAPLSPDTYTVTLVSGSSAISASNSTTAAPNYLDGSQTGSTTGSNYTSTITVAPTQYTVSIPDFARGPGQPVILPAATGSGLPIQISDGSGVTSVMLVLTYDPTLLTIAGEFLPANIPAGAQFVTNSTIPGRLSICITSPTPLSSGAQDLIELSASVPSNAPYRSKADLQIQVTNVNGSTSLGRGDQSVDLVTFLGNASGTGNYNSNDVTRIRQVLTSSDNYAGFGRYPLVDPEIVGNVSASGNLNSNDASILQHYLTSNDTIPQIPTYTGPPSNTATGPDPKLFISSSLAGLSGQSLTVPVQLLQTNDSAITLQSFSLVIGYDSSTFSVSDIRLGSLASGFTFTDTVDPVAGVITINGSATHSLGLAPGTLGNLVEMNFTILATAKAGGSPINLLGNSGTSITSLNGGGLTLVPAPTNAKDDANDGLVAIGGRRTQPAFRPDRGPDLLSQPVSALTAHDLAMGSLVVNFGSTPTSSGVLIPLSAPLATESKTINSARRSPTTGSTILMRRVDFRHQVPTKLLVPTDPTL